MPAAGDTLVVGHVRIPAHELHFSYARSSAPGGQNVNKVNSKAILHFNAVASPSLPADVKARFLARYGARLTVEGEVVIAADTHRDQPRNAEACLERLAALIDAVLKPPRPRRPTRPTRGSVERRLREKKSRATRKDQRRGSGWD
ncbi:MAG: aminoacyl-tRNA hydrolase [Deltaproteobacteria bacterium]|nr:aminoacyl-tRNA hydrolase [Deltaproteobacteria bacterium]